MPPLVEVKILRAFLGETAQRDGKPVHELLVNAARERGLAGATVTRGFMGFGANSLLRTSKILRLSEDLPVIVEIMDTPERIADFLPYADELVSEGALVVESAKAIFHAPLRIRDVMSAEIATVGPSTPLSAVVELLLRRGVKSLPVVEKNKILGVVTGGDLLQRGNMPLRLDVQQHLPPELRADLARRLDEQGLTAKDVMSSPVQTINVKARVPEALQLMARRKLKRLPVVDDAGRLMGVVSRIDLLRVVGKAATLPTRLPDLPAGLHKTARDVMVEDIPTAGPDCSLTEVLNKLVASPLRRVVIIDGDNKVLGIVLDRDLVSLYARQNKPGRLHSIVAALSRTGVPATLQETARDVMKTEVFTLRPETTLAETLRVLVEKKAKRLVVADESGHLLGMVDRDRLLRALADE
jgi:CBS-domain-containing membrane protein